MSALGQTDLLLWRALTGPYAWCLLAAPLLLAVGVLANQRAAKLNAGWLEWSPFGVRSNVTLLPLRYRWLRAPYAAAFALAIPFLALMEEAIFRNGTTSWVRGVLWGGVAFGAAHLFSLVSVRMVIYLSLVGCVFVGVYMSAGLLAVFVLHATYNLTALALVAVKGDVV